MFADHPLNAPHVSPPSPLREEGRRERNARGIAAIALMLVGFMAPARAQEPPTLTDVQIGFVPISEGARVPTHKVGLWAPVTAKVTSSTSLDGAAVVIESEDSEGCGTVTRTPFSMAAGETRTIVGYVQPGRTRSDIRVSLEFADGRRIAGPTLESATSDIGDYLYLSLGAPLPELAAGLVSKEKKAAEENRTPVRSIRFALAETDPARLPDRWQGYDGVDLVLLSLSDPAFLESARPRLKHLLDWVWRGGRLVVAVPPDAPERLEMLFDRPFESAPAAAAKSLVPIEAWSGLQNKPLPARGQPPIAIARLDLAKLGHGPWDHLATLEPADERPLPLLVRTPYGFGAITYVALSLDAGPFAQWNGQAEFFRTLADQIGPRYVSAERAKDVGWGESAGVTDWGAQLERELEVFDVPTPSFGTVALLMLLYILLVSAGDHFVLRKLLRRPEATWITLPLIALGVGAAAWFASRSPDDLGARINRITLVDLDVREVDTRTSAIAPNPARHDTSWFAFRSDDIRRLTLRDAAANTGNDPDTLTWFGRPDDGPAGMGRAGGPVGSQQSYAFAPLLNELIDVPFPFRAVKAFRSERRDERPSTKTSKPPLESQLRYHSRNHPFKVSGTIHSSLPVDLEEASLFVFDRVYRIEGGVKKQSATPIAIAQVDNGLLPSEWRDRFDSDRPFTRQGRYDPGLALRNILFHERLDPTLKIGDHLFRRLDWSWRLRDDPRVVNVSLSTLGPQVAILVGRAKLARGDGLAPDLIARGTDGTNLVDADSTRQVSEALVRALLPLSPEP